MVGGAQGGRKTGNFMHATMHHLAARPYFERQQRGIRQWSPRLSAGL
jgi:hypothetical protein